MHIFGALVIQAAVRAETGVLFLGLFVGSLIALALRNPASKTLRGITLAIGIALGGGPILFIGGLQSAQWDYPIGLVLGMLWPRLLSAREEIVKGRSRSARSVFAWIDILLIVGSAVAAILYSTL